MKSPAIFNDETPIPIRWLLVALGALLGVALTLAATALTAGNLYSNLSQGVQSAHQDIAELKAKNSLRDAADIANATKLGEISTKINLIYDEVRGRK